MEYFMKTFWYWWLFVCLNLLGLGVVQYFDGFVWLFNIDITKLSFVILFSYLGVTAYLGHITKHRTTKNPFTEQLHMIWYYADSCLTLGMIGTVVGFIYVLTTAFVGVDFESIEMAKGIIKTMALGMGTSLVTTLVGLIANLLIQLQLVNIEHNK